MKNTESVNKNAFFNTIKSVFGIIYPLISFPYISRVLQTENVGKINFSNSVVNYFSLIASLGVTTYAIRECSKYKEDKQKLSEVSSQILSVNLCSTAVAYLALVVTLLIARPLDHYRELILIQSASILFTTLGADWLNTAMEDFRFIAVRTVAVQFGSLLLMFLLVRETEDYWIYALITVVASSGANIINVFYRRRFCKTKLVLHMEWRKHLPPILLFFSLILSQTIYTSSDTTILGLYKGDFQVGLYSTSVKIYNIVNTVVASVAWVVLPQLSACFSRHDYKQINSLLKYSLNFIIVLGLPCIIGLNVITKEIILLIAGESYLGAAVSLHILTVSLACSFIGGWIGNMMMLPSGQERICLKSSIISAVVNIVLNLILIPIWGLNAAAATTVIAEFLGIVVKKPYIDRNIHISGLKSMLMAPLVGSMGILIVSRIVKLFTGSSAFTAILTIFLSVIVYLAVLILMRNEFAMGFLKPIAARWKGKSL